MFDNIMTRQTFWWQSIYSDITSDSLRLTLLLCHRWKMVIY